MRTNIVKTHGRGHGAALCGLVLACVLMGLFVSACGGGGGGERGTVPGVAQPVDAAAAASKFVLSLQVQDEAGAAVAYADVSVLSGAGGTTGADGRISMPVDAPSESGSAVRVSVSRNTYYPTFKTISLYPDEHNNGVYEYAITLRPQPVDPERATQASVDHGDGSRTLAEPVLVTDPQTGGQYAQTSVDISAEDRAVTFFTTPLNGTPDVSITFGSADGTGAGAAAVLGAAGVYTAAMTYGSPAIESDVNVFPGSFTTQSDTGNGIAGQGALVTAGFAYIEVRDGHGNPVRAFAPGAEATIRMRVPAGVQNPETGSAITAGDTIPVFSFDETTGEWVVEHNTDGSVKTAVVQQDETGLYVTFQAMHLTWWNLDFKTNLCAPGEPTAWVVDGSGNPVAGATVYVDAGVWPNRRTVRDDVVKFYEVSKDITWRIWAKKDTLVSNTVTIKGCVDAATGQTHTQLVLDSPCPVACTTNADCAGAGAVWPFVDVCANAGSCDAVCTKTCGTMNWCASCDDGNAATIDACYYSGLCGGACYSCVPRCRDNSECDDGDPATEDRCSSRGSCNAHCVNAVPVCEKDADCDDGNSATLDTCAFAGQPYARCQYCEPACYSDMECSGGAPGAITTCKNPGTCYAKCAIYEIACYAPDNCDDGDSATLDDCHNPGTEFAECTHCISLCSADADCDDDNERTIESCTSPGVCNASCARCTVGCFSDAECNDDNPGTDDVCRLAGKCQSYCTNICHIACSQDADCSDGIDATLDVCSLPGTCNASCGSCTVRCHSAEECNDDNPESQDICTNPGTCQATCENPFCNPLCSMDSQCDDQNPETVDTCVNPGTCDSVCQRIVPPHWELFPPGLQGQDVFHSLVGNEFQEGYLDLSGVAFDPGGNVYAAWMDVTDFNQTQAPVEVFRWNGAQIDDLSANLNSQLAGTGGAYPFLLPNPGGNMRLGLCTSVSLSLMEWNASQWINLGETLNNFHYPWMCSRADGTVVAAWGYMDYPRYRVYMSEWDTSTWSTPQEAEILTQVLEQAGLNDPAMLKLACGDADTVYATVNIPESNTSDNRQVYVVKWDGSAFAEVGAGSASGKGISNAATSALNPAITLDNNGRPIVAWANVQGSAAYLYVKRWTGAQWEPVGANGASGAGLSTVFMASLRGSSLSNMALAADSQGYIYLAWPYHEQSVTGYSQAMYVKKWDGSAWQEIGAGSASGMGILSEDNALVQNPAIILDADGNPYVFWYDDNRGIVAMRWNPGD